ncbi:MAG: riboflavin biosynthesis protein RibF [Erysipelotrichaceae bacterium]
MIEILKYKVGDKLCKLEPLSACIGYFDGLHLGHLALIDTVMHLSQQDDSVPTLITFEPDPWTILKNIPQVPQLLPMQERIKVGERLGLQKWIILEFDEAFAALSAGQFVEVLHQLNVKTLVCGFDFRFGAHGSGNVDYLVEHAHFQVIDIPKIEHENHKISTTYIESLIEAGEVEKANALMNRPFYIRGNVIHGNQKGRTIGFPTANVQPNDDYVMPKAGVYIAQVEWGNQKHQAIVNIGNNPTFNYRHFLSIEVHILHFNEMIYGKTIKVSFLKMLRAEQKFDTIQELVRQLEMDKQTTLHYFATHS